MTSFETPGPYVATSVLFWEDPDIDAVGVPAAALFHAMICKVGALRSDGWITVRQIERIAHPRWKQSLARLEKAGLILPETSFNGERAYYLPGYLRWNKSQAQIKERQSAKQMAGRLGGCEKNHPQPCERPLCAQARAWKQKQ